MPDISRRTLIKRAAALLALSKLASINALAANNPVQIGIVAKIRIPWFDNVEKGIKKAAADLQVNAWMIAPTSDDAAQQVRAVEDLIAKKVDVIGVIPNDGAALEPVFKRARDAGIHVIVHEQPGQKNADWDFELIQNQEFGEAHLEAFAQAIGGEGKYVVYVGGLTVALHNLWADYAISLQKKKYPKMQQVGDRFGVSNSVEDSYKTAVDQMRSNPDLKGFLIFGANRPLGAGQAVADRDQIGKVIVVGPSFRAVINYFISASLHFFMCRLRSTPDTPWYRSAISLPRGRRRATEWTFPVLERPRWKLIRLSFERTRCWTSIQVP